MADLDVWLHRAYSATSLVYGEDPSYTRHGRKLARYGFEGIRADRPGVHVVHNAIIPSAAVLL
jgi:hypothetical protein